MAKVVGVGFCLCGGIALLIYIGTHLNDTMKTNKPVSVANSSNLSRVLAENDNKGSRPGGREAPRHRAEAPKPPQQPAPEPVHEEPAEPQHVPAPAPEEPEAPPLFQETEKTEEPELPQAESPPAAASMPVDNGPFFVAERGSLYHRAGCQLLVGEPRELPLDQLGKYSRCKRCGSGPSLAAQPSGAFTRYYALMKNEFMTTPDGQIIITSREVDEAIDSIRAAAAEEKEQIDEQMVQLSRQIAAADAQRKGAEQAALSIRVQGRAAASEAYRRNLRTERYYYRDQAGIRTGVVVNDQYARSVRDSVRRDTRAQAASARQASLQAKGNVNAQRAELGALKKRSDELAAVCSPHSRVVPAKKFRAGLPDELQQKLALVGITQEQFRQVVGTVFESEASFLQFCATVEQSSRDPDVLVNRLRQAFAERR